MILYSTHCPLCKTLEKRLDKAGISYTVIDDEGEMIRLGFQSVPVLYAFGKYMNFSEAMDYLKDFHNTARAPEEEDTAHEDQHQA